MSGWRVAVGTVALLAAACGGGGDIEAGPTDVGLGLLEEPPTTSIAAEVEPAASSTTVSSDVEPAGAGRNVANRADRSVEDWSLSLVVADKTSFGSGEPMVLELTFANTAATSRHIDTAQSVHFIMTAQSGEVVWTDVGCGSSSADVPGEAHAAAVVEPGDSGRFVGRYPQPAFIEGESERGCQVPPGRYDMTGRLDWCPAESLADVTYRDHHGLVCDPALVRPLYSAAVRVELTS